LTSQYEGERWRHLRERKLGYVLWLTVRYSSDLLPPSLIRNLHVTFCDEYYICECDGQ